jgi:hypothetical protein
MRILRARAELLEDGVPGETYRRVGLDEALGLLASPRLARSGVASAGPSGLTRRLRT